MATLRHADFTKVEEFLRGLYSVRRTEPLIWYVLQEMSALVGTNQASWNRVLPCRGEADVMAWPEQNDHATHQSALARHLPEHPLITNFIETGDPRALKISDFLSPGKFHNTALYAELYQHLEYEDQFAMNLSPLGPAWTTLVVARDRRTFSERDRTLLDLVRPHIAQAYRNVKSLERFARQLEKQRSTPSRSRVLLARDDTIVRYPSRAQRWLSTYFDDLPNAPRRLPREIQEWLAYIRRVQTCGLLDQVAAPLSVQRGNRKLIIRAEGLDSSHGATLLLEERTALVTRQQLAKSRLTPREVQVLREVEKGKHNHAIAVILGIEAATVKKHLEHIYDKLGVDNRTAAVAQFRDHC